MLAAACACATERELPTHPISGIHPEGILDPASEQFHGREVARRGWDLGVCANCHGDDFRGGAANQSCAGASCHAAGPDACDTCHPARELSGRHAQHLDRVELAGCVECHVVPARWDAPGHVLDDPPPAEVVFGARAATTLDPRDRAGPPSFDGGTCRNVYCHGDVLHAGGGAAPEPKWTDTPVGGCAICHGAPPPSHARDDCATCHRGAPHIDGVIGFTNGTTGCSACHGDANSPAPPRDLTGNQFTTALGVGAHRAHLAAPSRLSAPIACNECHVVPTAITSPGHLDSGPPAEVFPAGSGSLARARGATVSWDRLTATCSVYCHGASAPVWTAGGQVFCGSCHGIPPASHDRGLPITACVACHSRSVDGFGNPQLPAHLDGVVDVD